MSGSSAVTLLDVARAAGVSRTTASAAIAQTGRVSDQTRQHVLRIADSLGYAPNIWARKLRQDRVLSIGLYMPDQVFGRAYYMDFAFGAAEGSHDQGVSLILLARGIEPDDPAMHLLDGVILVDPLDDDPVARSLLGGKLPVVTGEYGPRDLPEPAGVVVTDHQGAVYQLFDHLVDQGALRPALIAPGTNSHWGRAIRTGYANWCAERGRTPLSVQVEFDSTPGDVERASAELLDGATPPDAIVSAPDAAAVGAVAAVRARGLEVGNDVLIASYVDSILMQLSTPPITGVDLRPRSLGRSCAEMLLDVLASERKDAPLLSELPTELNIRASSTHGSSG
ncbi:LacI family DNA-binding transcriptional regulator [Saxibacter everestensis]|uniref:LacI family DNA-binding transcriptional regulator n=1 Tax=Saxibacter everestensis TaxID=2909229 RepID=A0ABY8QZ69_9MICO|nr:LacI family DNA-binding transcriptional regulator [Brevibacteriaceae bacterium ZFBP1038]